MEEKLCSQDSSYMYADEHGGYYCGLCDHKVDPPTPPPVTSAAEPPPATTRTTRPPKAERVAAAAAPELPRSPTPVPILQTPAVVQPVELSVVGGSKRNVGIIAAVVAIGILILILGGRATYTKYYGFDSRIDRAIAAGHWFSPPGENVADIFAGEKSRGANSSSIDNASVKIVQALSPKGEDSLRRWYVDSEGVDWDFVEKVYGFLEELQPGDLRVQSRHAYAVGQLSLQNQNHARALESFQRSSTLDPTFVLALNGIARVYVQDSSPLKHEKLALEYYSRVISLDPNFTWAYKNVGEYYIRKEDWRNAEAYMLRALRTSPERPSILRGLARIYFNQERYREALDYNQRYIRVANDPDGIAKANNAIEQIRQKLQR